MHIKTILDNVYMVLIGYKNIYIYISLRILKHYVHVRAYRKSIKIENILKSRLSKLITLNNIPPKSPNQGGIKRDRDETKPMTY